MPRVADIEAISVSLEIADEPALFVLLARDGTVNRLGTGAENNQEQDLYIGRTEDPLLPNLLETLSDDMLDYLGGYDIPNQKGLPCRLSITFTFDGVEDNGFGFSYGTESQGPPPDIGNVVLEAVRLTEPWYEEQKRMTAQARPKARRPWWKLW